MLWNKVKLMLVFWACRLVCTFLFIYNLERFSHRVVHIYWSWRKSWRYISFNLALNCMLDLDLHFTYFAQHIIFTIGLFLYFQAIGFSLVMVLYTYCEGKWNVMMCDESPFKVWAIFIKILVLTWWGMKCTLKPLKCDFAANFISYLGHLISRAGIKVNLSKTSSFLMIKMSEFEII